MARRLCFVFLVISTCADPLHVTGEPTPGSALYLTPYIESGRIQEARAAAEVKPLLEELVSYSGYLTVNKQYNSNLFFWFFPSEQSWTSKPVLLWLNGGPGSSSLLGLLYENGPIRLTKTGLIKNPYSWTQKHNVIYIDNPVGSGFSFTNSSDGYPKTQTQIGESYAGKYVPSVAMAIHEFNKKSPVQQIILKGLFIGNGMFDPINMLHYGQYLYQLGLLDFKGKEMFQNYERTISKQIEAEQWQIATESFSYLIMDLYNSGTTLFTDLTGIKQHFNYINDDDTDLTPFVTNSTIRRALHVGSNEFSDGKAIAQSLKEDVMKSMKSVVETLLEHYDILFYNGQLDIICAYPLTENVLRGLQWSGAEKFCQAQRKMWMADGELAGYCKSAGRLTEVMVRNAGHLVPTNQPAWALNLLTKFISGYKCV